jgi:hypothetical protein
MANRTHHHVLLSNCLLTGLQFSVLHRDNARTGWGQWTKVTNAKKNLPARQKAAGGVARKPHQPNFPGVYKLCAEVGVACAPRDGVV